MFHKISGIENFYGKEGEEEEGGIFKIFRPSFFCLTAEKYVENLLVCHYFRVTKNFTLERVMSRFSVETFFVSHYRLTSMGDPSVFHKLSGIEKIYGKEEGREGVSRFSVELFLSPVSKNFVGRSFIPSFISVIGKCQV